MLSGWVVAFFVRSTGGGDWDGGLTRRRRSYLALIVALGAAAALTLVFMGSGRARAASSSSPYQNLASPDWVGAWGVPPENANYPSASDESFRMIVHPTIGGQAVRIKLDNTFGNQPVTLSSISIAISKGGAAIDPSTVKPLTFLGQSSVTLPAGGRAVSDPVAFSYRFGRNLAVSFYLAGSTGPMTGHGFTAGIITSYTTATGAGNTTGDASGQSFTMSTTNKYFLMGLDAYVPGARGTVIAYGDSITDGTASTTDAYNDWPDELADRIQAAGLRLGVVNDGIGGNTVTHCPVSQAVFGDPAVARLDRDVEWPNVRSIVFMEGGNDLRYCPVTARDVEAGLQDLVSRSHQLGFRVLLGTYVPRVCRSTVEPTACPDSAGDDQRQAMNTWIRGQAAYVEAIVDFDQALRDPKNPGQQASWTGTADGIHPGPPGYKVMASIIPLDELLPPSAIHLGGGRLRLTDRRLAVRPRRVAVPLTCASPTQCAGKFSIDTTSRLRHTAKRATVVCATAAFSIIAGQPQTVNTRLRAACRSLLRRSPTHTLAAQITSYPRTGQHALITHVTLVLT